MPDDFVAVSRRMVRLQNGRPSQAVLRRALSTAYYALFHTLARCGADLLVGGSGASRSTQAWRQVYRALEHGAAGNACRNGEMLSKFPKEIEDFANMFVTMQDKRHKADYDPTENFWKSSVIQDINAVEQAIKGFKTAPLKDRRAFAAYVLFKIRK